MSSINDPNICDCYHCEDLECYEGTKKVFLILGQSNAGTQGLVSDIIGDYTALGTCIPYFSNTTGASTTETGNTSGSGDYFGVELSMSYCLQCRYKNFATFKYAVGGTGLFQNPNQNDWNVNSSGEVFDGFKSSWDNFVAQCPCPVEVLGIVWIQGEKDSSNNGWANAYAQNLQDLINGVYAHIGQTPTWINVRLNSDLVNPPQSKPLSALTTVQNAQETVGDGWINIDDLPLGTDGVHYDAPEVEEIGSRICKKFLYG